MDDEVRVFYHTELIPELKQDIGEFGSDLEVIVWIRKIGKMKFISNYDFITKENPVDKSECRDDEVLAYMTLEEILKYVTEQEKIGDSP